MSDAASNVTRAALADDYALHASQLIELIEVLRDLTGRYGEHPVLIETEADFIDDTTERVALYERAKHLALMHDLPTVSILLSLAEVQLEELQSTSLAKLELLACKHDLPSHGDDYERKRWTELMEECERRAAGK